MLFVQICMLFVFSPNNRYIISIKDLKSINGAKFHIIILTANCYKEIKRKW